MRIVLYSDLQLHPYKEFATLVGGVNDRLLDHFVVLDQIYKYAQTNHIDHIVFGGDMFEARARVDVIAAKKLAEWKYKLETFGMKVLDIVGNHDLVNKSTIDNALELYKHLDNHVVVSKPRWAVYPPDYGILCVPYMHRREDVIAGLNLERPSFVNPAHSIAIVHYGMYDVPMETRSIIRDQGYDTEGQIRLSDLDNVLQNVRQVFFGHFHITTSITDRIHFIGTPLQHKWCERWINTRFLDIDLDAGTFKGISTVAPKFILFESKKTIDPDRCKGNFCRVKVGSAEEQEEVKALLQSYGARGIEVAIEKKKTVDQPRLDLNLSMSFEEMGCKLLDADKETTLDKNKLRTTLQELLKSATLKINA